ncbi:MAG: cytochrome c oxidase subunit II [Alphaproteobacteria bacterium]|nr:cytochrome c oxidase subunit II [Alphaproteobacteria bacterium]
MFLKKIDVASRGMVAASALAMWAMSGGVAYAQAPGGWVGRPRPWEMTMQRAATPVMVSIEDFHRLLLYIITAVCLFVLGLLLWVMIRYNARTNPVPSKTSHNTLLEVVWTAVPVLILVLIAIPSFRLLYYEMDIPKPDVTIMAIGKQWYWTYKYPAQKIEYDSLMLDRAEAAKAGEPYLLGVDHPVVVPVNKVIQIETTGADVIHSWAVPSFGVKMDAVPGRINHTWFEATHVGTYYGQCSELCGARHAFMPIEVKVVTEQQYRQWLATAAKQYADNVTTGGTTRLAALNN